MYCPKCGKQIADDSVFCLECGERVKTDVLADANQSDGTQTPIPMSPSKKKKPKIGIIIAVCAAVIMIGVVAVLFLGGKGNTETNTDVGSLLDGITGGNSVLPNGVRFGETYEQIAKKDSGIEQDGKSNHANAQVAGSFPKSIFGIARSELYDSMSKLSYSFDENGKLSSVMFGLFLKSSEAGDSVEQYFQENFTIMPTTRDGYIWGTDAKSKTVIMYDRDGDTMIGSLWYYSGES